MNKIPACRQAGNKCEYNEIPDFQEGIWYVYVLECDDKSLYKGFTTNLKQRYLQHLNGLGAKHTKLHKPICLLHYESYNSEREALDREKYLKSGIGREFLKKIQKEYHNE